MVVDDARGLEDFLLGRNFLRAYNVLVDLTTMKIVVRALAKPVLHHAHAQTSNETLTSTVVLDQDVVLQPFERAVLRAKVVTSDLEAFAFRNVVINFATPNRLLKNTIFVEDTFATVGETAVFYVSLGNLTSNAQKVKCGTMLGTAAPERLVYHAIPQCAPEHKEEGDEKSKYPNDFVNRIYSEIDLSSQSKFSLSSEFDFFPRQTRRRRGSQNARSGSALTLIYWPLFLDPSLSWRRCKSCGDKLPATLWMTSLLNLTTSS